MHKDISIWMPLYIGDLQAKFARMTAEQIGAALLLMMDFWKNGAIPHDLAIEHLKVHAFDEAEGIGFEHVILTIAIRGESIRQGIEWTIIHTNHIARLTFIAIGIERSDEVAPRQTQFGHVLVINLVSAFDAVNQLERCIFRGCIIDIVPCNIGCIRTEFDWIAPLQQIK